MWIRVTFSGQSGYGGEGGITRAFGPRAGAVSHRHAVLGSNHRVLFGLHTPDKAKGPCKQGLLLYWRRGRDSNPRWAINPYALSRGAPSATRPPLRKTDCTATCPGRCSNTGRDYSACRPRPFGAVVASRRRCLAPAALGSNPRWALKPYAPDRGMCSHTLVKKIMRRDYSGIRMPIHKILPSAGLPRSGLYRADLNPGNLWMSLYQGTFSCCPVPALP
jgi:hypothetical protein